MAFVHSKPGAKISIKVSADGFVVENQGDAPLDKNRVFHRFYLPGGRRTGYPTVHFSRDTQIDSYPTPPHRLPSTSNELSYNSENCQAAISKNYNESTGYYTKLFWAKDNYYTMVD